MTKHPKEDVPKVFSQQLILNDEVANNPLNKSLRSMGSMTSS